MAMLSCKQVLASLSDYADDEASVELRKALEEHFAWCRRCRVVVDSTTRMLRILVDAEAFEVPLAVSARLYSRLEKILTDG